MKRRAILDVRPLSSSHRHVVAIGSSSSFDSAETSAFDDDDDDDQSTVVLDETFEEWFDRICHALHHNDPDVDELEMDGGSVGVTHGIDTSGAPLLDESNMIQLADRLQHNRFVRRLSFANMDLDIHSAPQHHLKRIILETKSLTTLHLDDVGAEGPVTVALALTLRPNSSIRTLHIKGTTINQRTAQALERMLQSNQSLTELRLCHNTIEDTDESLSHVAHGLSANRRLKVLDLMGNGLDDAALSKIVKGLAHDESILEFLSLDFNDIGTVGAQAIANMLQQKNCHLKDLHACCNRIGSEGAEALAQGLRHNSSLQTLLLSLNDIGNEGAGALAQAMSVNTTLTKLCIPSNNVGNPGLISFGEALPKMKGLKELHVGDFYDAFAAHAVLSGLQLNTKLTALYLQFPVCEEEESGQGCARTSTVEERLDFYLRLNKSGRSLLHAHSPSSLWPMVLEKSIENEHVAGYPDVLYCMLREKPDLMEADR